MFNILSFYNFVSRLSKREKLVFYGASIFVSLALIDRLIISPITSKIISLNEQIKERQAGIKRNAHILGQKERIKAEAAKYASYITKLESSDDDITSLLKEIENIANEASVYLIDIKPSGLTTEGGENKFVVKLNCEAEMENIARFMYMVESSDRLLTVDSYKINPKARASSVGRCSMSISKRVKTGGGE